MDANNSDSSRQFSLEGCLSALDGVDAILRHDIDGNRNYKVSKDFWLSVRSIFDRLPSSCVPSHAVFQTNPNILRIQILEARTAIRHLLEGGNVSHERVEPVTEAESIGKQINRLREECGGMTVEELAHQTGVDKSTVSRNVNDKGNPYPRTLLAYERVFSKILKRKILISKMQQRRNKDATPAVETQRIPRQD